MKSKSSFEDNTWRIISSFLILCWLMVIFYNYNKGTLSLVLIPAIISMGISIYAIIKPQYMWPYAVEGTFWGLMYIYSSGGITGFLLLFLGICFDIKCGFFKRFLIPKVLFLFACLVFVLYHVYTLDSRILFDTLLDSIVVILVILMLSLLFSKDIPLKFASVEESIGGIRQIFNEHEIAYIKLLGQNYKFYSIAQMLNVSESSVKRTFSKMYNKVNVKGKAEFLSKIKEIATSEELVFLNLEN